MPMFKGKFSTRKLAATKFKEKVNKVKGNDGGWSVDRYKQEIKDENGNVVDTVPLIVENPKKRKREDNYNIDDATRLKTEAFPKWAKISCVSLVAKFMRSLECEKRYTDSELTNMLGGSKSALAHFYNPLIPIEEGKSKGYGVILQRNADGTSQLCPGLVEAYKQHFN